MPSPLVQTVTLAQAIAIATAQAPALQIARDDYRLAQVNVAIVRTGELPSLSVAAAVQRGNEFEFDTSSGTSVSLGLQQLIFDGGKLLAEIRSAQASDVGAAATYQRAAQQLAYNVGQAYFSALQARAAVALTNEILKQNRAAEDLIRAQMAAGVASQVDLATAHVPTQRTLVQLAQAQAQDASAEVAFVNTLGFHANEQVFPADVTVGALAELPSYDVAVKRALLLRPDYAASQQAVRAAEQSLRAARLGEAPQLSLAGSIGSQSTSPSGGSFVPVNTAGVFLNLPLYDQGLTAAHTHQAEVQLDRARRLETQSELSVESDVHQALDLLKGAREALKEADLEQVEATSVLRDTQEQYRAGIVQLLSLLNAQSDLTSAENDRLSSLYALQQAEQTFQYAVGEIALTP
jgi:outer membrane protein TolC